MQRVDRFPESLKTAEKLESFADHDLGNNTTASIHLLNIPLLYQEDNPGGLNSYMFKMKLFVEDIHTAFFTHHFSNTK